MTNKQKAYKIALIKKIHITQKYRDIVRIDKEVYRDMLHAHFGVKSSTEMDIDELISLVDFLENKALYIYPPSISKNQESFIFKLWKETAIFKNEFIMIKYINDKVIRYKEIKELNELTKRDASKVIGAIKKLRVK